MFFSCKTSNRMVFLNPADLKTELLYEKVVNLRCIIQGRSGELLRVQLDQAIYFDP